MSGETENAALRRRVGDAEREVAVLRERLRTLGNALERAQKEANAYAAQLDALQASRSYRVLRAGWRMRTAIRKPFSRSPS